MTPPAGCPRQSLSEVWGRADAGRRKFVKVYGLENSV